MQGGTRGYEVLEVGLRWKQGNETRLNSHYTQSFLLVIRIGKSWKIQWHAAELLSPSIPSQVHSSTTMYITFYMSRTPGCEACLDERHISCELRID